MGNLSAWLAALMGLALIGCSRQEDPADIPQPQTRSQLSHDSVSTTQVRVPETQRIERSLDAAADRPRESLERQERP